MDEFKHSKITQDQFRSLRDPIMLAGYRIFGDILPFIGFEEMALTRDMIEQETDTQVAQGVEEVRGNVFTVEWLGKGISLGGFRVPVDH